MPSPRMISVAALCGILHLSAWAAPQLLPKDVASFIVDREGCDHWRGEPGFDKERQADIDWSVCDSCTGTDAKLAALKRKYRADKVVMAKLGEFEATIEPKDKAAAKQFCQTTRKPDWIKPQT